MANSSLWSSPWDRSETQLFMEQEQDKTICSLDHELISVLGDLQSD